jgi:hypothetical protein
LLSDIQLGFSLIAAAITGAFAVKSRRSAYTLLGCMVAMLILLFPLPFVTERLWMLAPHAVLDVTNVWPMQRLYPLLAAIAVFAALSSAESASSPGKLKSAMLALMYAAGLCWSVSQAQIFYPVRDSDMMNPGDSARQFRRENISLTRSSFLIFGFVPSYFSHSSTDPFLETRLIDPATMRVFADGSTTPSGSEPPGTYEVPLSQETNGNIVPQIPIGPRQTLLFQFDYLGREPSGVLQFFGRTLFREYRLPSSGEPRSFGSGATNSRVVAIRNTNDRADSVRMNFLPASGADAANGAPQAFARVTVSPVEPGGHVIELLSLIPFHVVVNSDRPALLETPKVFIPGYRARLNGLGVGVIKSGEGLVGVPLDAGKSDLIIDYPGSTVLRLAYGTCLGSWLVFALCTGASSTFDPSGDWIKGRLAPDTRLSRPVGAIPILVLAAILLAIGAIWRREEMHSGKEGALRLVVSLPIGGAHKNEPLLTTGRTGAGDVIYIKYLGGNTVSVCHDYWGHRGAESQPFAVNFMTPQTVEISMRSLGVRADTSSGVSVKWNGREVLTDTTGSYPPGPEATEIGANQIGASTCVPEFSGVITESAPIEPWTH